MNRIFSSTSAVRLLGVAMIAGVLGFGADVGVATAKAYLFQSAAATETKADAGKRQCRDVVVDADEGYGVRGKVTRTVCGATA